MGLKELFSRITGSGDARARARAERETHMTEAERDVDREDYEARKDDMKIGEDFAGSEAIESADDDLQAG